MKDFFKKVWGWLTGSNHPVHMALSMVVSLCACFVYSLLLPEFKFAIISTIVTVLFVGAIIEIYQYVLTKHFDARNSLGDMLADIIGGSLGILFFWLIMITLPTSSIILYALAFITFITSFIVKKNRKMLLLTGVFIGLFGFAMFLFA